MRNVFIYVKITKPMINANIQTNITHDITQERIKEEPCQATDSYVRKEVIGNHVLLRGDALKILRSLPDKSVNLVFVDPPYNIGKDFNGYKQ